MPEYKHPGVYIEETERGPKPIEGVPTTTAAFLGETQRGPMAPQLITSYTEYERLFGGVFQPKKYMPHAISGFFENGGRRAFVCRIAAKDAAPATTSDYEQTLAALENPTGTGAQALQAISLVYAPGATPEIARTLVAHCEKVRHRFALIDCAEGENRTAELNPTEVIGPSSRAAFFYPWIVASKPGSGEPALIPPGGHVAGIYARHDLQRGVFKAPADKVVRGALDVEFNVTDAEQDVLDPKGVNVIRRFPGRGIRLWGARTLSADAEWKYVQVRRFFTFLERSIEEGMWWVVFEPNDERLWRRVTDIVWNFLRAQWNAGALHGQTEDEAFFVKCDRSTMTEDDIENGRLVCEIGVALVRPAEFVIFRLVQDTSK